MFYPVNPPPKMAEAIRRQQAPIDVDEHVNESELAPHDRALWRASRPIFVALAWLDKAIRQVAYLGIVTFGVFTAVMVFLLAMRILISPVMGADLYRGCAALLPEHREAFLEAAEAADAGSEPADVNVWTCRLILATEPARQASTKLGSAGRNSFMNPDTAEEAIERSYPSKP